MHLHDIVEHAREDTYHCAIPIPVETSVVGERLFNELRQVHRSEKTAAIGRQRLLTTGVGRTDVLAEPVIVHLVDAVDEDESRLGVVVRGRHDQIPQLPRPYGAVYAAGHLPTFIPEIAIANRPAAPDNPGFLLQLLRAGRKNEIPFGVALDRINEVIGDEARQIELAQPAVFPLGTDEADDVGVADVEGAHLRTAPAAGRRHRETHGVEDIHKREGAGGVSPGPTDKCPFGAEGRELVADAATRFERETRLINGAQNTVHRIGDDAGNRAVDRAGGRLVFLGAGVRHDAARWDRAVTKGPQKALEPLLTFSRRLLDVRQRPGDAPIGRLRVPVDHLTALGLEPVFLVPNVERCRLKRDLGGLRC